MAQNLSAYQRFFLITLILCLLSTLFPTLLYSQNDIPSNGNPVIEMYFVPSCTSMSDAQTSTKPKGFYIAKYKVTRRLWNEIMGTYADREADDYLPVTNVSRDEVQLFILWLNQKTKMQYRLPTESEWTCAVRSGLLPDVTPSFYLGGNDASTGFRLAMDREDNDDDNDYNNNNNYNYNNNYNNNYNYNNNDNREVGGRTHGKDRRSEAGRTIPVGQETILFFYEETKKRRESDTGSPTERQRVPAGHWQGP